MNPQTMRGLYPRPERDLWFSASPSKIKIKINKLPVIEQNDRKELISSSLAPLVPIYPQGESVSYVLVRS
jgi:hypothetical protein